MNAPRDWVARAGGLLALATAGAIVAIAVSGGANGETPTTQSTGGGRSTATRGTISVTVITTPPTTTAPTTTVVTTTPKPPPAATPTGWTIVLQSLPADARTSAERTARAARAAGLAHVGVLESSRYRTLRPGFLVVYYGVWGSQQDAAGAVRFARAAGFPSAYARQIAR